MEKPSFVRQIPHRLVSKLFAHSSWYHIFRT